MIIHILSFEVNFIVFFKARKNNVFVAYKQTSWPLFTKSKYFNFKQPTFTSEIIGTAPDFTLVISSDVFVKDARIDFESSDAQAEQSYVDFTSSMPIRIPLRVPTRTTAQKLLRKLRITSHYDVGRGARK